MGKTGRSVFGALTTKVITERLGERGQEYLVVNCFRYYVIILVKYKKTKIYSMFVKYK